MVKDRSLLVSQKLFTALKKELKGVKGCYLETFNNCREQGYCLINYDYNFVVWACECRCSDDIMIVVGDITDKDINNMFSDKAYNGTKYFEYNRYDLAVKYTLEFIKNKVENK